jgi:hypothetical protein
MSHIVADRVKELTSTSGTGALVLNGAVGLSKTFNDVMTTGDTCYYCVEDGTAWEVGLGTFTSPDILARTTILSSSNSDSVLTLSSSDKEVFITFPARQALPCSLSVSGLGTINTTGSVESHIIISPNIDAVITDIKYCTNTGVTASDTNYITFTLVNKGLDGASNTSILATTNTTKTTAGHLGTLTANVRKTMNLTSTSADLYIKAGERLVWTSAVTGTIAATQYYNFAHITMKPIGS